jgi:hemerythrin-like domain-containing protein
MSPLAPLLHEHRLIERLVHLLAQEKARLEDNMVISRDFAFVEVRFLKAVVDFFTGYVSAAHHPKEEAVLWPALEEKLGPPGDRQRLQQLRAEHRQVVALIQELDAATQRYQQGQETAVDAILAAMTELINLYTRHLAEEQDLFLKLEEVLDDTTLTALADRLLTYDQDRDLSAYEKIVAAWEAHGCKCHL